MTYLENFLSLLGYFTTSFFVIIFVEHYWFRKGSYANYNLEAWNNPKEMPIGFAGGLAFALGIIGGKRSFQTWYPNLTMTNMMRRSCARNVDDLVRRSYCGNDWGYWW